MVRRNILMGETLRRIDSLARVKHEHLLQQIQCAFIVAPQLFAKWHPLAFRQALYEAKGLNPGQHMPKRKRKFAQRTFSLQMVSITSSGGVPSSSVIIENWFTSVHRISDAGSDVLAVRRTILSGEERLSLKHLGENAPCAPNVDSNIVFLPREHNLGGPIISRRHVASHLRILYSGKTKIAYLGC